MRRILWFVCLLAGTLLFPASGHAQTLTIPVPTLPSLDTVQWKQMPAIPLRTGDTLYFTFRVHTDTAIKVVGLTNIVPRGCGFSYFIVRAWRRSGKDSALVGIAWAQLQSKLSNAGVPIDTTITPTCLP